VVPRSRVPTNPVSLSPWRRAALFFVSASWFLVYVLGCVQLVVWPPRDFEPGGGLGEKPRRLTWSLPPHSPAATLGRPVVAAGRPAPPSPHFSSSPSRADSRPVDGQDLLLSRTMLGNHGLPYVGRFACGWPRLSTTDPSGSHPRPVGVPHSRLAPAVVVHVKEQAQNSCDGPVVPGLRPSVWSLPGTGHVGKCRRLGELMVGIGSEADGRDRGLGREWRIPVQDVELVAIRCKYNIEARREGSRAPRLGFQ